LEGNFLANTCNIIKFHAMNYLVIFGLFLITNFIKAQEINQLDANGLRFGYWVFTSPDDSTRLKEGYYVDGKKTGVWRSFFPSGVVSHEITWENDTARGLARFYYPDGTLREEGYWTGSFWTGTYRYFHDTGKAAYEFYYNSNGRREGEQRYFHADGALKFRGEWNNGDITGQLEVFNQEGNLVMLRNYGPDGNFEASVTDQALLEKHAAKIAEDSEIVPFRGTGFHTVYRMNGQVFQKGEFRNGVLINGEEYLYDEQNQLLEVRIFTNGQMVGVQK